MRVWQLDPGNYRLIFGSHASDHPAKDVIIAERGQRIPIMIPSRRLLRIEFEPALED
jgi:hypothetical protein